MASFTKEFNLRLAKRRLVFNGHLVNVELNSLLKEATDKRQTIISEPVMTHMASLRADSRFVPSQWERSLQSNGVSHWLGPILESALITRPQRVKLRASVLPIMRTQLVWHFNAKQYLKYTYEIDVTAHLEWHRADHNDRNTSVRAVLTEKIFCYEWFQIDGLVQERRNSIALAMEFRLTCTNPSK